MGPPFKPGPCGVARAKAVIPRRADPQEDWGAVLALIHDAFAYMDGVIDPPSSINRLGAAVITAQADIGEVWLIGENGAPLACVFMTYEEDALYLGKIAVAQSAQGQGLARALVEVAHERARAMKYRRLRLQSRIELTTNHATFRRLGFEETAKTRHPGFERVTSLTFEAPVKKG